MSILGNDPSKATIVVAVDFSNACKEAIRTAVTLAAGTDPGKVRAVHVIDVLAGDTAFWDRFERTERLKREVMEKGKRQLASFLDELLGEGHAVELDVRFGKPADNLAAAATEDDVELLVMGTTGIGGVESTLFGTTAARVTRELETPLLMVGEKGLEEAPKTILAPIDFSDCSRSSIKRAASIARKTGGEVLAYHTMQTEPVRASPYYPLLPTLDPQAVADAIEDRRNQLAEFLKTTGVDDVARPLDVAIGESVRNAILEKADEVGADLICLGSHGRKGIDRVMLGSNASAVLRKAKVPVMVIRT